MPMLFACHNKDSDNIKQEIYIENISIYVNEEAKPLKITFSNNNVVPIEYTYDVKAITISNGKVSAKKEGEYIVKAKTSSYQTEFTVYCLAEKKPIKVENMYAWVGYPSSEISIVLDEEIKSTTLIYEYDKTMLNIENNKVTALKEGDTLVKVKADIYEEEFIVSCKNVDKTNTLYYNKPEWTSAASEFKDRWILEGTDNKTTIFIGDSFFDHRDFWTDFYTKYYANKDALCFGIGGTTSHTWELLTETLLSTIQAKNVVVDLGNNNIYNDGTESEKTIEDLQRFYTLLHGKMPNANIYIFSITARAYDNVFNYTQTVKNVNAALEKWAKTKSWITFIDLQDVMTIDKLKDQIHPKLEHYSYYVEALYNEGAIIEEK